MSARHHFNKQKTRAVAVFYAHFDVLDAVAQLDTVAL
jgi:hypothetical protein